MPPVSAVDDQGFGIYVHWPFCEAKCPYCDFNSHVRHAGIDEVQFRDAYLRELDHMRTLSGPREVESVFFGGGTPSRMLPETAAAILERIAQNWQLSDNVEITLEANPTSVEAGRFDGFRAAGINRVSVGLQALNDVDLKKLGRTHDVSAGKAALAVAKKHFDRVSFDLIYARSGQTTSEWQRELEDALILAAGHLSLYQLTIEEGTPFAALHAAGKLVCPQDDAARAMYEITQEACDKAGLPSYEVSNHAAPGHECRHNLIYWRAGGYAGVGPGAHSRLNINGARHAISAIYSPEDWVEKVLQTGHGIERDNQLGAQDEAAEYMLMGLRLNEGIDLDRYAGLGGKIDETVLAGLEANRFVRVDGKRLATTPEGRLLLNSVIAALAD